MRLWVNVGCPHAEAFEDVKKEAAERVWKCRQMEKRFGPLAQIQPGYPKIEFCQYAPSENIVKKGSIVYMAITDRI